MFTTESPLGTVREGFPHTALQGTYDISLFNTELHDIS